LRDLPVVSEFSHVELLIDNLVDNSLIIATLGVVAAALTVLVIKADKLLASYLKWGGLNVKATLYGLLGAAVIPYRLLSPANSFHLLIEGGVAFALLPALCALHR
jgi:hypothetical protein